MEVKERIEKWLNKTAILTLGMVFVFTILVFFARPAKAINQQITFQGKLTNTSGYNVANGTYYVKLTIYNASTGGTCQYSATSSCASVTSTPVTVTNGIFSVNLGDTSASLAALPATLFNAPELYLGITVCSGPGVGCDSEMTPRKRITAVPYAFNADYLGGVTTSTAGGNGSYIPATDSSGNLKISNSFYVATSTTGQVGVGTSTVPSGVKTYIESTTASDKLLVIRGQATQSGNFTEWQDSAGNSLASVSTSTISLLYGELEPQYDSISGFVNLTVGNTSGKGGLVTLQAGSTSNAFGDSIAGLVLKNSSGVIRGQFDTSNNTAKLTLTGGTTTSTFDNSSFTLSSNSSNYRQGVFYVNSSGNISASGTLTAYGSSTLGDSDAAGGDTTRIYGSLALGAAPTGGAQVYIVASSTTSKPLVIRANATHSANLTEWQTSGGSTIGYFATSSAGGTPNIAVLSVGSTSVGGFLVLQGDATTGAGFLIYKSTGVTTVQFNTDGDLTLSNGTTVTSTYSPNSILLAKQTNFELGKFYVDSSGNVSASGTLGIGTGALTGTNAVGFGNNITVSGHRSFAFGNGSMATGSQAFAGGTETWAGGNDSFAFGNQVAAFGSRSFAFGNNATASVSNAFVFGDNVKATAQRAFIFGRGDYTVDNAPLVNNTLESFMVGFGTSTYPALMVSGGGVNSVVGIATTSQMFAGSTRYRLLVDAQGTTNPGIGVNGYIKATGVITQSTALDLAEKYPIDPGCEARGDCPEAGDVVAAKDSEGGEQTFYVYKAAFSDDEKIIGVISTQPGFLLEGGLADLGTRNLTLAGRVPVKVSVENGAIHVGDKLAISSSAPGMAAKYTGSGTVVGMALENYTSVTPGKIIAYVSLGWDRPYTNSKNISVDPLTNPQNPQALNTQSNGSQLVQQNLDMGGYSILNIKSIAGKDDKWEIDENGWLVNTLATTEGKRKVYGVASESAELNLSGSGQLVNGEARVDLATSTKEMLSAETPIKVSVTLTAEARGVYVAEKGGWGFKVKELNGGASNATFDWVIIARRKTQSEIDAELTQTDADTTNVVPTDLPTSEADEAGVEESSSSTTSSSSLLTGGTEGGVVTTTESIATGSD